LLERWLAHLQQPTVVAPPAFYPSKSPSQVRARLIAAAGSLALSFFGALVIWQWQPARTGPGASNSSQPASRPSLSVEQLQPQPAIVAAAESPMSAQAVDAELQRLGQATGALEVDLVFRAPTSFSAEQNLGELQWRLFVLEQELAASRSPRVLPAPAQKPPSDTITNP
jgi:hypothetical protein